MISFQDFMNVITESSLFLDDSLKTAFRKQGICQLDKCHYKVTILSL